ncbi:MULTISPECIES: universal stress protein [unclassified Modestobacter]|uniref:universal stress protein n=1 Tax=unclassified Modestobacter TaxID=2643866 RepID=UPI0022AB2836|nr:MULTISPECIES: universal stress protein [unclassified Modestobacter]MCZ2812062.1 universal stress protein [Modestobacter sp. VKM Ac-2979]MCZ2843786.1 universal stress protein [Modestobacter sp. VKM Ac-2980]MCZ2849767.1 universal stress protein [Modestobacter sp. VKM Ac-2978]
MGDGTKHTDRPEGSGIVPRQPRVVVGVDGSAGARAALVWALGTAARTGAALEVVSAFPIDFYWTDPYLLDRGRIEALRSDTEARTRELVEAVRRELTVASVPGSPSVVVEVVVVPGAAAEHLVRIADGASLLVVGSRGRGGVRSTLLGSVALHCSTHAACPVVVVHPSEVTSTRPRVVVGVDGSVASRAALVEAVATAARSGAEVEAVAAFQLPNYWSEMSVVLGESLPELQHAVRRRAEDEVAEVLGDQPVVSARVVTVEGPVGDALVQRAAGAELLVVGSRSRNRLPGMVLGSAALHCVVNARCPVMVVHPPAEADARSAPATLAAAAH